MLKEALALRDKEKIIIETAIKLFSQKGYSSTSIQEIASESGISKGAFYLHFKSKDALLVSIFTFYFDQMKTQINKYKIQDLLPREKFTQQLNGLFSILLEHKEFIIMQTREQVIPLNESIKNLMFQMHAETNLFYRNGIKSIYGSKVEPYLWDLSLMLDGLFSSYVKIFMIDQSSVDIHELVQFILRRMDHIVEGLLLEEPFITKTTIDQLLDESQTLFIPETANDIEIILGQLKKVIDQLENENLAISFEVLESEINKETPRIPVIQGMLSNFKDVSEVEEHRKEIADYYKINLN